MKSFSGWFLVIGMCLIPIPLVLTAQITVGSKVIYPGGADAPPKEKDVGVSLKVDNLRGSEISTGAPGGESMVDRYESLLYSGQPDALLKQLGAPRTPIARVYHAIALYHCDQEIAAHQEGLALLKDPGLPEDLRERLLEEDPSLADNESEETAGELPPAIGTTTPLAR